MGSELSDDMERLGDIGDQVLAGTPIEEFDLTVFERHFVIGYTRRAVESYMDSAEGGEPDA